MVGVCRRTGTRWRNGRRLVSGGRVLNLPPVITVTHDHEKRYSPRYLSEDERIRLTDLRRERRTMREIAALMGRSPSTICRELARGCDAAGRYRPFEAHRRPLDRRRPHRLSRLARDPTLHDWVVGRLQARWSPEQIAHELRREYPDEPDRWLCAETVLRSETSASTHRCSPPEPDGRLVSHQRKTAGSTLGSQRNQHQEARAMLYAGLDLSRQRVDVRIVDETGRTVEVTAARPGHGRPPCARRAGRPNGEPVEAAIESMNGARFVHDTLERLCWDVAIADTVRAKGLAPLVAKSAWNGRLLRQQDRGHPRAVDGATGSPKGADRVQRASCR